MALLGGLIYTNNVQNIGELKHSKIYNAQSKEKGDYSMFGYVAIKLEEDVTFYVGWRPDEMTEYNAKKGEYLVQTVMQPPRIVKSWDELRTKYKVFQK